MKRRNERRLFDGARVFAPVFLSEVEVGKFLLGRGFPEEGRIKFLSRLRNPGDQLRRRRRLKGKKDVRRLDLAAAAGRELHLIGASRLREHRTRLEGAVIFKIEIHND